MTKEKAGKIDLSLITDRILHSSAPVPLISCMYACMHAWIEVKSVLISIQPFSPFYTASSFLDFLHKSYHNYQSVLFRRPFSRSFLHNFFSLSFFRLNLRFIICSNFFLSISFYILWLLDYYASNQTWLDHFPYQFFYVMPLFTFNYQTTLYPRMNKMHMYICLQYMLCMLYFLCIKFLISQNIPSKSSHCNGKSNLSVPTFTTASERNPIQIIPNNPSHFI